MRVGVIGAPLLLPLTAAAAAADCWCASPYAAAAAGGLAGPMQPPANTCVDKTRRKISGCPYTSCIVIMLSYLPMFTSACCLRTARVNKGTSPPPPTLLHAQPHQLRARAPISTGAACVATATAYRLCTDICLTCAPLLTASSIRRCTLSTAPGMHMAPASSAPADSTAKGGCRACSAVREDVSSPVTGQKSGARSLKAHRQTHQVTSCIHSISTSL
jgi:hypothetical protein